MFSKRPKLTHYKIAGRDEPIVQVVKHHRTTSQSLRAPKATKKKRKAGPRTVTFRVEGSLHCDPNDPPPSLPSQLHQDMFHPPTSSANPLDELNGPYDIHSPQDASPADADFNQAKKTANEYLASWLAESSQEYLKTLYDRESPPGATTCSGCQQPASLIYRCKTCLNPSFCCCSCLLSTHHSMPTHRVEYWDHHTWTDTSLNDLGFVLSLGHCGSPCTLNNTLSELLVGDLNGFSTITVRYCMHPESPKKPLQLLSAGLFPCSDIHPRSAFTISLLDTYNTFLTLGRTSAHKFYSVLERISKPGFPEDVKDRYRELMAAHRKYLYLSNLRRSGLGFEPHVTDVHPGDQALDCVACPRPGINFEWEELPEGEQVWFRAFVSYDGNFRSVRKSKKVEPGDICLSDGSAYFPPKGPYKEWTEAQSQPQRTEKPTCDHHKAGNDTSVRWVGQDVTGIGALTCTSHSCFVPRGIVDFFKGERFIYADYALASAVSHLTRRGHLTIGLTYDVWCHWITNFWRRAPNLPLSITLPPHFDLVGAIPKWHLIGHDQSCYVRWSLDHTQYVGRMEGEGPERVWAHLNEHSGSTSEQGPGVRTDTLNNLAYEWNFEKMIRMAQHLPSKFKEAKRMYQRQKAVHADLTASLPHARITEWEMMPLEPVEGPNKKWSSPLMDPVWTDGRFQSVIHAESKKETSTARVARRRLGATRWVSDGIELEHNMRKIHDEAREIGLNPTPRQAESLNYQRVNLRNRISQHQKRHLQFMTPLADQEPDHPERSPPSDDEPEHSELGLPSSFSPDTLITSGLSSLADLEKELRRGMCNDALDSVRHLLGARALALNYKKRHVRGEVATTRAEASLRAHSAKISKARWRYDNSRNALLRLGADASDLQHYQELTSEDLKTLKSFLEDDSRGVGQGYTSISWIWRRNATPNVDEWQVNALRTEWFRSRERYKRWEEQLILLKREMTMTIRTFRKQEEVWHWKARSGCPTPGMRGYAFKQSRFYGELARRALQAFRTCLYDEIVALKWSDAWLRHNINDAGFIQSLSP